MESVASHSEPRSFGVPSSAGAIITVTTTYLHIPSRTHFRPVFIEAPDTQIIQAHNASAAFYRFLYGSVGRDYHWIDRFAWSDEQIETHLARPTTTLLVLYVRGVPAGYVELDAASSEPGTEVAYFGLIGAFHGRGLGKHLLSAGVQRAFDDGAARVWVHTCTLDGKHALANYQGRGFMLYNSVKHEQTLALRQAA
jgi:ribosomal protein S18 acetylase RimI-like enzyme